MGGFDTLEGAIAYLHDSTKDFAEKSDEDKQIAMNSIEYVMGEIREMENK